MKLSNPLPYFNHTTFFYSPIAMRSQEAYEAGDYKEALRLMLQCQAINGNIVEFPATIAVIYAELNRPLDALEWSSKAVSMCSSFKVPIEKRVEIYSNHGSTLTYNNMPEHGLKWLNRARRIRSNDPKIWNNLGNCYMNLQDKEKCYEAFRRAIATDPEFYIASFNLGNAQLLFGDVAQGWENYQYRVLADKNLKHNTQQYPWPWWNGEDLDGKTIYVSVEQGAGDTFQFSRYIFALRSRFPRSRIIFQASRDTYEILKASFSHVADVVPSEYQLLTKDVDYRSLLMCLPLFFPDYKPSFPYLTYPSKSDRKSRNGKLSVGIAWFGNPNFKNDHNRSIHDTKILWPLLDMQNDRPVQFFSLQSGQELFSPRSGETAKLMPLFKWDSTLSIMDRLDLVISVDTSIAHVAGALGKPVWVLLPKSPDWRWGLCDTKTHWYPSANLYRQAFRGSWDSVLKSVAHDLDALISKG